MTRTPERKGRGARREHAVVLGASVAGLLAARALADAFERVTVVERDALPDGEETRKGVPQGAHAHGLLAGGYRALDELFPGMMDELAERGAPLGDVVGDFLWFLYGRWKLRHRSGIRGITVSRPCLEAAIRRRVRDLPRVDFLEGASGIGPVLGASSRRITGLAVRLRDRASEETLEADLVVDASGRGSQSPKWLEELGFGRPPESAVRVDVGYSTRTFERRPGDFFGSVGGIVNATPAEGSRMAAVLAAEDDRWIVTLAGTKGDHPPATEPGWLAFAASLPVPAVRELATTARPLSEIVTYRFPANRRRRYERMRHFPEGYLVVGDAVCSFNPIYGQGMSVAALQATALRECVAAGPEALWTRFYARAKRIVDVPWSIATGEDLRDPAIAGPRPIGFRLTRRYLERVHAAASVDATVCRRFFDVLSLLAPPSTLFAPAFATRVLARRVPPGHGSPVSLAAEARPLA